MQGKGKAWTIEDVKECLYGTDLIAVSNKIGRSLASVYTLRSSYKNHLKGKDKWVSPTIIKFFDEVGRIPVLDLNVVKVKKPQQDNETGRFLPKATTMETPSTPNTTHEDKLEAIFDQFKESFLAEVGNTLALEVKRIREVNYKKGYDAAMEEAKSRKSTVKSVITGILNKLQEEV